MFLNRRVAHQLRRVLSIQVTWWLFAVFYHFESIWGLLQKLETNNLICASISWDILQKASMGNFLLQSASILIFFACCKFIRDLFDKSHIYFMWNPKWYIKKLLNLDSYCWLSSNRIHWKNYIYSHFLIADLMKKKLCWTLTMMQNAGLASSTNYNITSWFTMGTTYLKTQLSMVRTSKTLFWIPLEVYTDLMIS